MDQPTNAQLSSSTKKPRRSRAWGSLYWHFNALSLPRRRGRGQGGASHDRAYGLGEQQRKLLRGLLGRAPAVGLVWDITARAKLERSERATPCRELAEAIGAG
jgi:hypothetical protein